MHDVISYVSHLKIREQENKKLIFCSIRKKDLVLQPEELVRQAYIMYLTKGLGYSTMKIAVEKGIKINGLHKRFDIMVYDQSIQPYILVECKSMFVELNQDVLEQVSQYNLAFKVPFLVITNGKNQFVFQLNQEGNAYHSIPHLPLKEKK